MKPRLARALVVSFLLLALPMRATTIPADLQARADAMSRTASLAVLAWVHDEGARLARASGPIDVAALGATVRAHFGVSPPHAGTVERTQTTAWAVLGSMEGADIEALCFLVLMAASRAAQEDRRTIMKSAKVINDAKALQRSPLREKQTRAALQPTKTPTPAPDRVAQFSAAARVVEGKLGRADLSRVALRR